jgi:H/ACA ribonucleoprotein complex subunit 4
LTFSEEYPKLDYRLFLEGDFLAEQSKKLVTLREEPTDPSRGAVPSERKISDHLKYGFIPLDKPQGPTSHEVVAWVRKIAAVEKAGHSGTLDPMVSGVLPIALESGTKALSVLLIGPKEYVAVARIHDSVDREEIDKVVANFTGPIFQKPPQKSSVRRATRTRTIYKMEIEEQRGNLLLLRVLCEAGTYIRKLIYDMGEVLKVGATMVELRRSRVCQIRESDLRTLHELYEAFAVFKESGNMGPLKQSVLPIESAVDFLKQVRISDAAVDSICHGAQLALPGVCSFSVGVRKGEPIQLLTLKGELVAIAEASMNSETMQSEERGIAAVTRRVVMDPGTYPKLWKRKTAETVPFPPPKPNPTLPTGLG